MDESIVNRVKPPLVLIPARNEESSIADVLSGCLKFLPDARLLVVDNASTDKTGMIAKNYGAEVLHEPNVGYSSALRCGYLYALQMEFSVLIQMDADGQHPIGCCLV